MPTRLPQGELKCDSPQAPGIGKGLTVTPRLRLCRADRPPQPCQRTLVMTPYPCGYRCPHLDLPISDNATSRQHPRSFRGKTAGALPLHRLDQLRPPSRCMASDSFLPQPAGGSWTCRAYAFPDQHPPNSLQIRAGLFVPLPMAWMQPRQWRAANSYWQGERHSMQPCRLAQQLDSRSPC